MYHTFLKSYNLALFSTAFRFEKLQLEVLFLGQNFYFGKVQLKVLFLVPDFNFGKVIKIRPAGPCAVGLCWMQFSYVE